MFRMKFVVFVSEFSAVWKVENLGRPWSWSSVIVSPIFGFSRTIAVIELHYTHRVCARARPSGLPWPINARRFVRGRFRRLFLKTLMALGDDDRFRRTTPFDRRTMAAQVPEWIAKTDVYRTMRSRSDGAKASPTPPTHTARPTGVRDAPSFRSPGVLWSTYQITFPVLPYSLTVSPEAWFFNGA